MVEPEQSRAEDGVMMPAPTPWPMVLAFGVVLLAAGLVTHWLIAGLGLACVLAGAVGWGRVAQAAEGTVWTPWVPAEERPAPVAVASSTVDSVGPRSVGHRMLLPATVHPYSSGARGGIAGGGLMALVAAGYGILSGHGLWYPVNLLAGVVVPGLQEVSVAELQTFHAGLFAVGLVIHGVASTAVGVLYGVLLPMLPGRPIVWGGIIAPLLWTSVIHEGLSIINPPLADHVSWPWFLMSQLAYGVLVGRVIEGSVPVAARAVGRASGAQKPTDSAGRAGKESGS